MFAQTVFLSICQVFLITIVGFSYCRIHIRCTEWTSRPHRILNPSSLCYKPRLQTKVTLGLLALSMATKASYLMVTQLLIQSSVDPRITAYVLPMLTLSTSAFLILAFASELREWLFLHIHRMAYQQTMRPQSYVKIVSRIKTAYAVCIYVTCLVLFVMGLYVMHVDRRDNSL